MQYVFDGIVLEAWSQLAGRVEDQHLLRLVEDIGELNTINTDAYMQSKVNYFFFQLAHYRKKILIPFWLYHHHARMKIWTFSLKTTLKDSIQLYQDFLWLPMIFQHHKGQVK